MDIMLSRILQLIGKKHGANKELCDALGVKANAVTDWKAGRNKSYPKYAPQIAEYYGVSLDWLSGLSDEKSKKETPDTNEGDERQRMIAELMSYVGQLSPEKQQFLLQQAKALAQLNLSKQSDPE